MVGPQVAATITALVDRGMGVVTQQKGFIHIMVQEPVGQQEVQCSVIRALVVLLLVVVEVLPQQRLGPEVHLVS